MLAKVKKNILFLGAIAGNYLVCLPVFRLFAGRFPNIATSRSVICIDGYPRSGNTYFVSAFLRWNEGLPVSHHTHLAGSAKYAINRQIPTVIIIRKPEDVVPSIVVWDGLLSITVALIGYIHFYQTLWRHREDFLILSFEDVTRRPDACVSKINNHFNTQFDSLVWTAEEDEQIRARLARVDVRLNREGVNSSLPNREKSQLKNKYTEHVLNHRLYSFAHRLFIKYTDS